MEYMSYIKLQIWEIERERAMLTVIRFLRAISTIDLTQQDYRKILLICAS